jgi:hypothetical protein
MLDNTEAVLSPAGIESAIQGRLNGRQNCGGEVVQEYKALVRSSNVRATLSVRQKQASLNFESDSLVLALPDKSNALADPEEPHPASEAPGDPAGFAGAQAEIDGTRGCVSDAETKDSASSAGVRACREPSAGLPGACRASAEHLLGFAARSGSSKFGAASVKRASVVGRSTEMADPLLQDMPGAGDVLQGEGGVAAGSTVSEIGKAASTKRDLPEEAKSSTSKMYGTVGCPPAASRQLLQSTSEEEGLRITPRKLYIPTDLSQLHAGVDLAEGSGGSEEGAEGLEKGPLRSPQGSRDMGRGSRGSERRQDVGLLGDAVSALEPDDGMGSSQMGRDLGFDPHIIPDSEVDIIIPDIETDIIPDTAPSLLSGSSPLRGPPSARSPPASSPRFGAQPPQAGILSTTRGERGPGVGSRGEECSPRKEHSSVQHRPGIGTDRSTNRVGGYGSDQQVILMGLTEWLTLLRQHPKNYSILLYKRWGSVADLTCHLQGSTPYGIRFSHKSYRPSPTKAVT